MVEVPSTHIIQDNWYWQSFLEEVNGESLISATMAIQESADSHVRMLLHAHEFNRVPKEDEPRNFPSDCLEFKIQENSTRLRLIYAAENIISPLNNVVDTGELVDTISKLDLRFRWIDWIIGVPFEYGEDSDISWGAGQLWNYMLSPWIPWVI